MDQIKKTNKNKMIKIEFDNENTNLLLGDEITEFEMALGAAALMSNLTLDTQKMLVKKLQRIVGNGGFNNDNAIKCD